MLGLIALGAAIPTSAYAQAKKGAPELKHITDTLDAGGVSLAVSKVGLQRANAAWVKKFAKYENDEQETVKEILISAGGKPSANAAADQQQAVAALQGLASADFDMAFLKAQLEGHQKLLTIQETFIKSGSDAGQIGQAKLARGQILEHLDLIQTISAQMRA